MGAVLVIDDDPHIRELVELLLRGAGLQTLGAGDGREALRILGEAPVDLCVVDAMMPQMDGVSFTRAARRYDPELPLLLDRVHPCHEVVKIDYHLPGCPPSADCLWQALTALLSGKPIDLPYELIKYD